VPPQPSSNLAVRLQTRLKRLSLPTKDPISRSADVCVNDHPSLPSSSAEFWVWSEAVRNITVAHVTRRMKLEPSDLSATCQPYGKFVRSSILFRHSIGQPHFLSNCDPPQKAPCLAPPKLISPRPIPVMSDKLRHTATPFSRSISNAEHSAGLLVCSTCHISCSGIPSENFGNFPFGRSFNKSMHRKNFNTKSLRAPPIISSLKRISNGLGEIHN